MAGKSKLMCAIHVGDTDGTATDTVRRHVSAELWIDGDDHHMLLEGILTGTPAQEMKVEQIVRDDLNLSPRKAREALAALHQEWQGDDAPERMRSARCQFEVSRERVVLDRIANDLAEAVWE